MILPAREDRGIVVFWVLPSFGYSPRLATSFALIATGFVMQLLTDALFPGLIPLVLGNLLLLVKGYDNRVDVKAFDPDMHWEPVELERLQQVEDLHKKIRRWDRSALDVTNPLGVVVAILVAAPIAAVIALLPGGPRLLAIDAAVLLTPHWITGTRKILVRPKLLVQIEATRSVLAAAKSPLERHEVVPLMLLSGGDTQIPEDVKFRVDLADRREGFLGLYGQVVINEVQGTSYPYFYVVLVGKKGFGLGPVYSGYRTPEDITKEFDTQGEVEVMVIRQHTTENSGYHTKPEAAWEIFHRGLALAEEAAADVPA